MITSFFISVGGLLITALAAILPASSGLPGAVVAAFTAIGAAVNNVSFLIPVGALFAAVAIVAGYEAVIWLWHGALWVWRRIPIIGR